MTESLIGESSFGTSLEVGTGDYGTMISISSSSSSSPVYSDWFLSTLSISSSSSLSSLSVFFVSIGSSSSNYIPIVNELSLSSRFISP